MKTPLTGMAVFSSGTITDAVQAIAHPEVEQGFAGDATLSCGFS